MFITKQILNEKHKKLMQPHKRQILSEIKSSMDDEDWQISRQMSFIDDHETRKNRKLTRPKTAQLISQSVHQTSSNSINRCSSAQKIQKRTSSFMKKVNYQFKQIKQITSLFDNFFKIKKKKIQPQKIKFPQNVKIIKDKLLKKQKQRIQSYEKKKRQRFSKAYENQGNQYLGYPKQKIKKIIPVAKVKNQNVNNIMRCIKGGYFSQADEYSDVVNKGQLIKLKKNFITMDTLYEGVKGRKNKGICQIKPQNVDQSSFKNLVYFLQNQKHLKYAQKMVIQEKLKLIS